VLVAVAEGRVVGHVQLTESTDDSISEIKNMAVDAAYRHRNIGTALIDAAVAHTRTQGSSRLAVATASADVGNLRFYQRAGFRVRSVERDAFSVATGYAEAAMIDGVPLQDRIWLDLDLDGKA
jgi:ribosomal protein S18 acetylase RimI-like enzyme